MKNNEDTGKTNNHRAVNRRALLLSPVLPLLVRGKGCRGGSGSTPWHRLRSAIVLTCILALPLGAGEGQPVKYAPPCAKLNLTAVWQGTTLRTYASLAEPITFPCSCPGVLILIEGRAYSTGWIWTRVSTNQIGVVCSTNIISSDFSPCTTNGTVTFYRVKFETVNSP